MDQEHVEDVGPSKGQDILANLSLFITERDKIFDDIKEERNLSSYFLT